MAIYTLTMREIKRDIARAHGGDITLANHTDGGLIVTLTLPRQETITGL